MRQPTSQSHTGTLVHLAGSSVAFEPEGSAVPGYNNESLGHIGELAIKSRRASSMLWLVWVWAA
jgi:hypothetical protein